MTDPRATSPQGWILAGPTAAGKTDVAHAIARRTGAAILSADAMQVYRGMDVGTAKPSPSERAGLTYLGMDLVAPTESFSAGSWLAAVRQQREQTWPWADARGAEPGAGLLVVGGSGLYLRALLEGLDAPASAPETRARWQAVYETGGIDALRSALAARDPGGLARLADPANPRRLLRALELLDAGAASSGPRRPPPAAVVAGLRWPAAALARRIAERTARMFADGLTEEVSRLRVAFPHGSPAASRAIGYAEAQAVCDGLLDMPAAAALVEARTRQLARRQMTWLRHQLNVAWVDAGPADGPDTLAAAVLDVWRKHGPAPLDGL